jgi:hypothetical protein
MAISPPPNIIILCVKFVSKFTATDNKNANNVPVAAKVITGGGCGSGINEIILLHSWIKQNRTLPQDIIICPNRERIGPTKNASLGALCCNSPQVRGIGKLMGS